MMPMTRRQRHERILESFGSDTLRWHRNGAIARFGLAAFTDAAVEWIARDTVASHRRQQRYNRENRARLAKAARS